jgi:hypothetical protein
MAGSPAPWPGPETSGSRSHAPRGRAVVLHPRGGVARPRVRRGCVLVRHPGSRRICAGVAHRERSRQGCRRRATGSRRGRARPGTRAPPRPWKAAPACLAGLQRRGCRARARRWASPAPLGELTHAHQGGCARAAGGRTHEQSGRPRSCAHGSRARALAKAACQGGHETDDWGLGEALRGAQARRPQARCEAHRPGEAPRPGGLKPGPRVTHRQVARLPGRASARLGRLSHWRLLPRTRREALLLHGAVSWTTPGSLASDGADWRWLDHVVVWAQCSALGHEVVLALGATRGWARQRPTHAGGWGFAPSGGG